MKWPALVVAIVSSGTKWAFQGLMTALVEQLGLKLEPARGSVEVLCNRPRGAAHAGLRRCHFATAFSIHASISGHTSDCNERLWPTPATRIRRLGPVRDR
jgi:uncharacterized protein DUF3738